MEWRKTKMKQKMQTKNKDIIIGCDKCEHEFLQKQIKIKSRRRVIEGRVFTMRFFACPKCKHEYFIDVSDLVSKKLGNELKALVKTRNNILSKRLGLDKLDENTKLIQAKQEALYEHKTELKRLWFLNE